MFKCQQYNAMFRVSSTNITFTAKVVFKDADGQVTYITFFNRMIEMFYNIIIDIDKSVPSSDLDVGTDFLNCENMKTLVQYNILSGWAIFG